MVGYGFLWSNISIIAGSTGRQTSTPYRYRNRHFCHFPAALAIIVRLSLESNIPLEGT
jgi:hypothetical protein